MCAELSRVRCVSPAAATGCVVFFALLSGSCGSDLRCGKGTHEQRNKCELNDPPTAGDTDTGGGDGAGAGDAAGDQDAPVDACGGCFPGWECVGAVCMPGDPPAGWTCASGAYGDGTACDCACGATDPDCNNAALPVNNCLGGLCNTVGQCEACTPDCSQRACGNNGCGGNCGLCTAPDALYCIDGACAACTPSCSGRVCGPDGCGGSCGQCARGSLCNDGQCARPPEDASCQGLCGASAAAGCSCRATCKNLGTCCADVALCGCLPDCRGRECGDDGCGGLCGSCTGQCVSGVCRP